MFYRILRTILNKKKIDVRYQRHQLQFLKFSKRNDCFCEIFLHGSSHFIIFELPASGTLMDCFTNVTDNLFIF